MLTPEYQELQNEVRRIYDSITSDPNAAKAFFDEMATIVGHHGDRESFPIPDEWQHIRDIPQDMSQQLFVGHHPVLRENKMVFIPGNSKTVIASDLHGSKKCLDTFLLQTFFKPDDGILYQENHQATFLGDYVDRGMCSLETLITVLELKRRYPNKVVLLQGNHESDFRRLAEQYRESFCDTAFSSLDETHKKGILDAIEARFQAMPLATLILNENPILCVHGGPNPTVPLQKISDILNSEPIVKEEGILFSREGIIAMGYTTNTLTWGCPIDNPQKQIHGNCYMGRWRYGKQSTDELKAIEITGGLVRGHSHFNRVELDGFSHTICSTGGSDILDVAPCYKQITPNYLEIDQRGKIVYVPLDFSLLRHEAVAAVEEGLIDTATPDAALSLRPC